MLNKKTVPEFPGTANNFLKLNFASYIIQHIDLGEDANWTTVIDDDERKPNF